MKKLFILPILFFLPILFLLPNISQADGEAGIVVTPRGAYDSDKDTLYLGTTNRSFTVTTRYCGNPGVPKRDIWIEYSDQSKSESMKEITISGQSDPPSGTCDKGYYGIRTDLSWTIPETIIQPSISIKVKDNGNLISDPAITISFTDPPAGIGDGDDGGTPPNLDRDDFSGFMDILGDMFKVKAKLDNPTGIARELFNLFLKIVGIAAVIIIFYASWIYITSGGDAAKAEKGKKAVIGSVIGLIIVMLTFVIIRLITNIIN